MDGSRADVIGKTCGQCKKRVTGLSSHPLAKVSGSHVPGKKLAFSVVAAAVRTVFAVVPFTVPAGPVGMFLTLGRFGHAFGPRQQGLARKTEFARLLVHRQQLDINLVAFLQHCRGYWSSRDNARRLRFPALFGLQLPEFSGRHLCQPGTDQGECAQVR